MTTENLINQRFIKKPVAWGQADPPFKFKQGTDFFGLGMLHPKDLINTLAVGATGSGKTESAIKPLLFSMLNYRTNGSLPPAMLVLDPKAEFRELISETLRASGQEDRLYVVGEGMPIRLFEPELELSVQDRVKTVLEFCDCENVSIGRNDIWLMQGKSLIHQFAFLYDAYAKARNANLLKELAADLRIEQPPTGDSFWHWLKATLAFSSSKQENLRLLMDEMQRCCSLIGQVPPPMMRSFTATPDLIEQWCYTTMSAISMLDQLTDNGSEVVDLDITPINPQPRVDISELVNRGAVILFTPGPTNGHHAAAKALKVRYYESVFARNDMRQPVFIVLDEAHLFVTEKEANLLDRCRAYRCCVILATQSLSSLRHAMGSGPSAERAVEILVANSPSRFTFRTTDDFTIRWLKTQLPPSPFLDGPHVLEVRPLTGLQPGEAYWTLADNRWGRGRTKIENLVMDIGGAQ